MNNFISYTEGGSGIRVDLGGVGRGGWIVLKYKVWNSQIFKNILNKYENNSLKNTNTLLVKSVKFYD